MISINNISNIKQYHTIFTQIGLIIAMSIMLVAFKVDWQKNEGKKYEVSEQETVQMEEVIQTKQIETPPPPPRPPVPVEVPNDEVIEDNVLNLDAELDLDSPLDLPPPPPSAAEKEEEEIFLVVENKPELIGGIASLQRKIEYPETARQAGIQGRVIVQFVVDEQGNVVNPRVVRGIGGGCDKEALRVIKEAKFRPGTQRGRPVKVQYTLPLNFTLSS